jgi:hypothetical protein
MSLFQGNSAVTDRRYNRVRTFAEISEGVVAGKLQTAKDAKNANGIWGFIFA